MTAHQSRVLTLAYASKTASMADYDVTALESSKGMVLAEGFTIDKTIAVAAAAAQVVIHIISMALS
jgi:hypothetical protein